MCAFVCVRVYVNACVRELAKALSWAGLIAHVGWGMSKENSTYIRSGFAKFCANLLKYTGYLYSFSNLRHEQHGLIRFGSTIVHNEA